MGMEIGGEYAIEALLDTPHGRALVADLCRKLLSPEVVHILSNDEKQVLRVTLEECTDAQ